jgi:hypothetical protein
VICDWRTKLEIGLIRSEGVQFSRIVLCGAAVEHRWELPRSGITLSPVPESAPRPWTAHGEHPAVLRMRFDGCQDAYANATFADRRAEWYVLLLNAVTPSACHEPPWGRSAWAWERTGESASKWLELMYFAPEAYDEALVDRARQDAPPGPLIPDYRYYVRFEATVEHSMAFPASLDDTIAAADALPAEKMAILRRAARWIKAADRAGQDSRSLNFLGILCGIDALARDWSGTGGSRAATQKLFSDLLPCYSEIELAARKIYDLRSALAHGGKVMPEDWIDHPMDTRDNDFTLLMQVSWLCRLVVTNWIRARAGLPLLPQPEHASRRTAVTGNL